MIIDETKITSFQSIITVVLRELRVAQGIHQAVLSDHCNKPSSFWEKVEAGKNKLDLDTLLRVCRPLDALPSEIMSTAEKYRWAMEQRGWSVLLSDVGNADALMDLAPKYWASPGYRFWLASDRVGRTILDTPRYFETDYAKGWFGLAAVFEFAVNERFRASQLDEERHQPFVGPPKPGFSF